MLEHPVMLLHGIESSDKHYMNWRNDEKPAAAGGDAYVDVGCAWIVRRLNHIGITTLYSCQGYQRGWKPPILTGYLLFKNPGFSTDVTITVIQELEAALSVKVHKHENSTFDNLDRTMIEWIPVDKYYEVHPH